MICPMVSSVSQERCPAAAKAFLAGVRGSLRSTFCFVFLFVKSIGSQVPGFRASPMSGILLGLSVWSRRRGGSLEGYVSGFSRLPVLPHHSICLFNPGHYPSLCLASGGSKCDPAPLIARSPRLLREPDWCGHSWVGGGQDPPPPQHWRRVGVASSPSPRLGAP